jgi:RimJ/RimL family protein N-acetyltransferase
MARNPVLIDVPERIETERLLIRCPGPGDGARIVDAVEESFDELDGVMHWAKRPISERHFEAHFRLARAEFLARKDLPLLVFGREDERFLGGSGLHNPDWSIPKFEIGYWLRTSETGKGIMTEAVAAIAHLAFESLGARRVEIRCDSRNEASAAVARRLGFEEEGRLRNHRRAPDGEISDTLVFARTTADGLP